jgi:tetratricopeptide (TPR) repeat protein
MIGQTLSHYRIVDRIGAGGMGVVYLAHDEQLERNVAIKVLPPGLLTDDTARRRFRKEALSLGRLNHPNIATVHEFGSHDGSDFLVTEHVVGTTLDARIAQGPLPVDEVLSLGMQLVEGLSAAHQRSVVHRDLKPGNLLLTTDGRLKIIDFGIAQLLPRHNGLGGTETVSQLQELSGTLPYMAPEQLRGEMADTRSDIWSAGAVLYQMATGKRPFPDANPAVLINAIQNRAPASPRDLNPAISTELQRVILKSLGKDPAHRYQTAADMGVDLKRLAFPTSTVVVAQPWRWRPLPVLISAMALLLISIGAYLLLHRARRPQPTAVVANRRRTIAVLGFKNLSEKPEEAWLSTALSEMLTTELSQGDHLRTIPGESVAQMKVSLSLPDSDSFGRQTLNRIRQNLGSDDVVLGSYLPLGDGQLRLDLRLQDANAGETLVSVSEKGKESEIDELVNKAGTELRAKLGIGALSEVQSAIVKASLPSNTEAARFYSEGLQSLRIFDALSAIRLLNQSATLDPDYAPTYSALAEAWSTLGYDSKAKQQATRALDLSLHSSREEKLLIEGRAHELSAATPQANESYRVLWEFFPDNIDYGLLLVRTQIDGGQASDAKRTVAELRKRTVSEADMARVDLAEAFISSSLSDFKQQNALAEQAANRGRAIGANLLVAQALQLQANALERMGQTQRTIELVNQARALYVSAGDRHGAARALLMVGDVIFDNGDYEGARKQFEDALPVFREIGAGRGIRSALERIGNVYYHEGKLRESEQNYKQALRFDREINDQSGLAGDYGNLANDLDGLGDLTHALAMQQQSLAVFNQIGDRRGVAETLNNLGNLFVETGNLAEARRYFERALALSREINYRRSEPYPISGLGDTLFIEGELAGARKQYEQALALCKEMNDEDFVAQLNVSLASIALAEKRYADGESLAGQAAAHFEKSSSAANVAWSQAVMARNLLGAGKWKDARTAAEKAIELSRQSAGQTTGYEAVLADARVKAASGKLADARQEIESMLTSTRKFGYGPYEYQARLAQDEIELRAGSTSAAGRLAALESDATARGFLLVAHQAHTLSQTR